MYFAIISWVLAVAVVVMEVTAFVCKNKKLEMYSVGLTVACLDLALFFFSIFRKLIVMQSLIPEIVISFVLTVVIIYNMYKVNDICNEMLRENKYRAD